MRRLPLLALAMLVLAALAPAAEARCRMAPGWRLVFVPELPRAAPGGTVLLELVPSYREADSVTLPVTTLRGADGSTNPLRSIALDLYALTIPAAAHAGPWHPIGMEGYVTVDPAVASAPAPSAAPALSSPPMGSVRVGSTMSALTFELAAPAPTGVVGLIATRGGVSWFMRTAAGRTQHRYGPPRCTPDLDGWVLPRTGESVSLAFVSTTRALSPGTTLVVP